MASIRMLRSVARSDGDSPRPASFKSAPMPSTRQPLAAAAATTAGCRTTRSTGWRVRTQSVSHRRGVVVARRAVSRCGPRKPVPPVSNTHGPPSPPFVVSPPMGGMSLSGAATAVAARASVAVDTAASHSQNAAVRSAPPSLLPPPLGPPISAADWTRPRRACALRRSCQRVIEKMSCTLNPGVPAG